MTGCPQAYNNNYSIQPHTKTNNEFCLFVCLFVRIRGWSCLAALPGMLVEGPGEGQPQAHPPPAQCKVGPQGQGQGQGQGDRQWLGLPLQLL